MNASISMHATSLLKRVACIAAAICLTAAFGIGATNATAHESGHHDSDIGCSHHLCHYSPGYSGSGVNVINDYDITGDGVKDEIKIVATGDNPSHGCFAGMEIWINGKLMKTLDGCNGYNDYFEANILCLENGKPFLHVGCTGANDDGDGVIYQYKGGKLVTICSNNTIKTPTHHYLEGAAVSKNTLKVTFSPMNPVCGSGFYCTYNYAYKSGTLKRTSSYTTNFSYYCYGIGDGKNYVTASRSFTCYKSSTCKTKKFTVKTNTRCKILKVRTYNGNLRFYIKTSKGKYGWVKCPSKATPKNGYDCYFKECHMAG